MLRLTFTDERGHRKILGESEDVGELYLAVYAHAQRLFIHPNLIPVGKMDSKSCYIVGQTSSGCRYEIANLD